MVKSISSSEIQRINFRILIKITILPFLRKLDFLGSYNWRELIFPFFLTEHKYWETNATHSSPKIFIDPLGSLWNQARAGPLRLAGNTLHRSRSSLTLRIIA